MTIISKTSRIYGADVTSYWTGDRWVLLPQLAKVYCSHEEAQKEAIAIIGGEVKDDVS